MASLNQIANGCWKEPLFSFGVIADVQYADIPDGRSFLGIPRFYRHSILVLQRAVGSWNGNKKIKFVINFGDIVDGFCPKEKSLAEVQRVIGEFEKFNGPVYHMLGNHCLYNLPRSKLVSLMKMPLSGDRAYYDFSPSPGYRIVVLDAYDFSVLGWPTDHPITLEALNFLDSKNPNKDKNSPNGLVHLERRFVMFNGAVGKQQLRWLKSILHDATIKNQKVIICSHLPLNPDAAAPEALLWNYDEVMAALHEFDCVKACFAGHDHTGGYSIDARGIHHCTFEAALECPPGSDAYGYVDVYDDRLSLIGFDRMKSNDMLLGS